MSTRKQQCEEPGCEMTGEWTRCAEHRTCMEPGCIILVHREDTRCALCSNDRKKAQRKALKEAQKAAQPARAPNEGQRAWNHKGAGGARRRVPGEGVLTFAQERALQGQPAVAPVADTSGCVHHWVIETPNGPTSRGVCKKCGWERNYANYTEGAIDSKRTGGS